MAGNFSSKRLAAGSPAIANVTLYTAPASTKAYIHFLGVTLSGSGVLSIVCNDGTSDRTVFTETTTSQKYQLHGLVLNAGDSIKLAVTGGPSVSHYWLSGAEET